MNDGLQAKESTRNGTEPPSRDTSHRTLPHPKPSGSKALEPRSAVASKGSETGIRLRLQTRAAWTRRGDHPLAHRNILHHFMPFFQAIRVLWHAHPSMHDLESCSQEPTRSPFKPISLHTALPSHRSVRQVAASPRCHATSSVRQAPSSARQSRCAFDIRLAGAIVD
jgi:hypothetical protein